ncbi:MAG: hypothetical protein ACYTG4_12240, partial [Planctomycetota bacterium]
SGYAAAYVEFARAFETEFPHVRFEPVAQFSDFPSDEFYDPVHLWPRQRKLFGNDLFRRLREILQEVESVASDAEKAE